MRAKSPYIQFVLTDAGRGISSYPDENNDCAVRAIAIVTGRSYDHVHNVLAKMGRKRHRGTDSLRLPWIKKRSRRAFGGRFDQYSFESFDFPIYARHLSKIAPKGRWLFSSNDHIWALIDGVHHDDKLWLRKRIVDAWRYIRD